MDNRERAALRELTEAARGFIDGKPKTLRRLRNATTEAERALGEARAAIEGKPRSMVDSVDAALVHFLETAPRHANIEDAFHAGWEARAERVLEAPPRESRTFDELLLAFDREEALSANEVRRLWDEGYFEYSAKGFQRLSAIGER